MNPDPGTNNVAVLTKSGANNVVVLTLVQRIGRFSSSSLLGPMDLSFGALSGRLKVKVRHYKFNKDSFSSSF